MRTKASRTTFQIRDISASFGIMAVKMGTYGTCVRNIMEGISYWVPRIPTGSAYDLD